MGSKSKYDEEFRQKALELSDKVGNKKAAEQLSISIKTIDYWRMVRKREEQKKVAASKKNIVKKEEVTKPEFEPENKPIFKKDNRLFKRGDIYYVAQKAPVGCEIAKGRPAIIVSNNRINDNLNTLEVVFLTTQKRVETPEHIYIASSGMDSTAICEQVTTVDKSRVERYIGSCTIEEIDNIEKGILSSLKLESRIGKVEADKSQELVEKSVIQNKESLKAERDAYKLMFEAIIEKIIGMNR